MFFVSFLVRTCSDSGLTLNLPDCKIPFRGLKPTAIFKSRSATKCNGLELYLTRVGMRRLAAGVCIAQVSFVDANSIKLLSNVTSAQKRD
jgi:hypothetical protein